MCDLFCHFFWLWQFHNHNSCPYLSSFVHLLSDFVIFFHFLTISVSIAEMEAGCGPVIEHPQFYKQRIIAFYRHVLSHSQSFMATLSSALPGTTRVSNFYSNINLLKNGNLTCQSCDLDLEKRQGHPSLCGTVIQCLFTWIMAWLTHQTTSVTRLKSPMSETLASPCTRFGSSILGKLSCTNIC